MANAENGVAYVSFGTTHACAKISKMDYILRTFTKLEQTVLIKWDGDVQSDIPENIMIKKWFPQQDILAHKNIRVFITHGGVKSITEARYHAVPVIGIPIRGDQFTNVDTAVKEGWGFLLRFKDLNKESVSNALSEVLSNPKYKEAAQKMSILYRDRPNSAMDTAIYWTEYVIRHHGAPHLQSPTVHLTVWQRNSLDVIAFLAVIFVVSIKLSIFFLKYCCKNMSLNLVVFICSNCGAMHLIFVLLAFVTCLGIQCNTSRILLAMPYLGKSHCLYIAPLMKALSDKGHNVTVMSQCSFSQSTANYKEIKLDRPKNNHITDKKLNTNPQMGQNEHFTIDEFIRKINFRYFDDGYIYTIYHSFQQLQWQEIMREESFDLIIIEIFRTDCLVGLGDHFKCPVIGFYSGLIDDHINDLSGNPMSVASVPHSLLGNMKEMDFITKLKTFLYSAFGKITSDVLNARSEECYKSIFPYPKYRPYDEMKRNISLFFINEHVSVDTARALVPNVIPVGGLSIKSKPDPLPQDIQNFMDNAKDGVAYVSFGTTHTCANITETDYIFRTLTKLMQRVLIKWNGDIQLDTPENVMMKKWFPQQDILAHKNFRVFITHGGIKGITEARFHAVPIIGIPMFHDQYTNVDTAVKEGWGFLLRLKDLNEESLSIALTEVLNNPKYKEAAQKMSILYRDRPNNAMDTAIYWTEYVIRHHGAPHLQSPAVHLNFWERNSLDVIAFLGCSSSRILLAMPINVKSHFLYIAPFMKALADKGHNVTVMSQCSFSEPTANYREIKLDYPVFFRNWNHRIVEKLTEQQLGQNDPYSIAESVETLHLQYFKDFLFKFYNHSFHQPQWQKIMQEESFDLVFIEIWYNHIFVGLGDHFKCPVIGFFSGIRDDQINDLSGNPMSVASVPHSLLGNMKEMDFMTKLKTFIYSAFGKITSNLLNEKSEEYYKTIFPYPKYRPYDEMRKNISLFLINEHVSVDTSRALVPNVIPVGGLNIKSKPDQLPQDIRDFMDHAKDGVVYISFGTTPESANITETYERLRIFSKLKKRVLLKRDGKIKLDTPGNRGNIMMKNWFPQQDILAHKNVRVFITHGGIKGITEARYHAVPIIGIPLLYDQFTNVDTAVKEGWGFLLRLKDLNEESLSIALSEVLSNPKYKEAAQKMSTLYRDRPNNAMDTAIYWTEYVIRHHGAPHLQSPTVHLNVWEQNSLDVIAFLAVIFVVTIKLSILFLKFCCKNTSFKFRLPKSVAQSKIKPKNE
ncbi:hypothetical protein DMENIID0001_061010 [Sergentomyia squamirostris]